MSLLGIDFAKSNERGELVFRDIAAEVEDPATEVGQALSRTFVAVEGDPADGDAIVWDESAEQWVPAAVEGGGALSVMSEAEGNAGVATTARAISAARLVQQIEEHGITVIPGAVVRGVIVETGTEARPSGTDVVVWIDPDDLGATNAISTDPIITPGAATGIPDGGTTGQALVKASDDDGDVEWRTVSGGGGGGSTGDVQFVVARTGGGTPLTTGSWVTYPLDGTPSVNIGGGSWNSGTYIYTIPEDGLYMCLGAVRTTDDNTNINLAVGIGVTNADGAHVLWGPHAGSYPGNRSGRQYTRLVRFSASDQVRMYIYVDGSAFNTHGDGHGQYMSIVKLAD